MLTAATAALLVGPAYAASNAGCDTKNDDTNVTTKVTTPLCTSTAKKGKHGDITISDGGSVEIPSSSTAATVPAITLDSNNSVTIASGAKVVFKDTDNAIGVQIDAGNTGEFASSGLIDLTGKGTAKTGILLDGKGTFTGDINLIAGSALSVQGDSSTGLSIASGATLDGNLTMDGTIAVNASNAASLTASSPPIIAVDVAGNVTGDVVLGSDGSISAVGAGAEGMLVTGDVSGSLQIRDTLTAAGTLTPSTTKINPAAGSALMVGGSVDGGILIAGPAGTNSTTAPANISTDGSAPAVIISPSVNTASHAITIGLVDSKYSLLSRGTITSLPSNFNINSTALLIGGDTSKTIFTGGIYTSGTISASAKSSLNTSSVNVTAKAIEIGANATIPSLTVATPTGAGNIGATISGPSGGAAIAILIDPAGSGTKGGSLATLINGGTISASATTTDTTAKLLNAYAILDEAGHLTTIRNQSGATISATATTLDAGNQNAVAVDVSANRSGVTFDNQGTVTGDILFGTGADTLNVSGSSSAPASISGHIDFGGGSGAHHDSLTVGANATVTGAITEDAVRHGLDIKVENNGTLNLANTDQGLDLTTFTADNGSTLGLTVSQAFNANAGGNTFVGPLMLAGQTITVNSSKLNISYGSFLSPNGNNNQQFILMAAPTGNLTVSKLSILQQDFTLPFLYQGGKNGGLQLLTNQTLAGSTKKYDELVLSVQLKKAKDLGLKGYALQLYGPNGGGPATLALAGDNELGGAVVTDIASDGTTAGDNAAKTEAQRVFDSFAPNVSGETRAIAISITDQATGPVATRQRDLRMYAGQDSDLTLWSEEFGNSLNEDAASGTPGFRNSGFGFAVGADAGNPQAGRYGAAFTFFSGSSNEKPPRITHTTEDWYMATGYTDWRGRGFFLDTQASVGIATIDGKRVLTLSTLTRTADGSRNALMGDLGATTGVIFNWGGTVLTPQISVDGMSMREEGYTEKGGGPGFDLHVAPYYTSSLRGFAGIDLRQDIKFAGFYFQPEIRGGYRYDLVAGATKLKANFAGAPNDVPAVPAGVPFTIEGPPADRSSLVGGASLSTTTDTWSFGLNYDVLKSSGGFSQMGTISLIGRI